ncbi:hypothetical protein VCRA2113O325_20257 [Vibrio crassostreae]|nr:hypothetical protein VCRA2113O326_160130 [Vibrio crassostreae]CAK2065349.1 hypothetical protein VCRA2113O322_30317 [Vibrio crassostreae]CAK2605180.1 hypothetical protein VCRA2113O321_160129 [Vibrio crassostreae]CAK2797575.1 hypothetical protein VCRA2113O323_20254 [Vibrio crassostreae]CAK2845335.1 hypothetical protein VCRA2113O325_20257 [Vibrio crassostreae]
MVSKVVIFENSALTNNLRVTPNAWWFHSDLNFVFTAQWFSLGVIALSHLNWALTGKRSIEHWKN